MVDDGSFSKSLNDEVAILNSLVILDGNLNNSILNEEHPICNLVLLADELALLKCYSLH